jgi:hypothetical protein
MTSFPTSPGAQDLGTGIVETVVDVAGTIWIPGFPVFEPVVNDAIGVLVPLVERCRWLPRNRTLPAVVIDPTATTERLFIFIPQ